MTKLLIVPWDDEPRAVETANTLTTMQEAVGGNVECIALLEDLDLWANDEAQYSPTCMIHTGKGDVIYLVNQLATAMTRLISPRTLLPPQGICGTVVLSGGVDRDGETLGIGDGHLATMADIWQGTSEKILEAAESIKLAAFLTS